MRNILKRLYNNTLLAARWAEVGLPNRCRDALQEQKKFGGDIQDPR